MLRMDKFYADYSPRPAEQQAFAILDGNPGGLGNLLQAIWPYEEELTVGLWRRTRDALNDMVEFDELARPYLSIDDYFSVVATAQQPLLDQALYRFRRMQERAIQTWGGFKRRVRALPREFCVSVTVPRDQETRLQTAQQHAVLVIRDGGADITYYGQPMELPPQLRRVLCALARRPGRWVSVDDHWDAVWDEDRTTPDDDRAVRGVISRLRGRLRAAMPAKVRAQLKRPDDIIACRKGREHRDTLYRLPLDPAEVDFSD